MIFKNSLQSTIRYALEKPSKVMIHFLWQKQTAKMISSVMEFLTLTAEGVDFGHAQEI